jgi:predicted ATP-grasp superfamily ATP-dependent carboligase
VGAVAIEIGADFVLPLSEASILALQRFPPPTSVIAPNAESFARIRNKELVLSVARELGIAVPDQVVVHLPEVGDPANVTYPVVVKPARSVVARDGRFVKTSVSYARSPGELRHRLAILPAEAYPILLQSKIEGPGEGVFLLVSEGRTLASFAHRRIREMPPSGGISVCSESVPMDAALLRQCERLLTRLGWNGVAMVEFKRSEGDGTPYLMEINGRFWGSLQLAVDAGVDFPLWLLEVALGRAVPVQAPYRVGIREQWEWGEADHHLSLLRASGMWGAVNATRSLGRAAVAAFRSRSRTEVFRFGDPTPFLTETAKWIRDVVKAR